VVHVDIKKVGRIPDGGGWRAYGRGSEQAKTVRISRGPAVLTPTAIGAWTCRVRSSR